MSLSSCPCRSHRSHYVRLYIGGEIFRRTYFSATAVVAMTKRCLPLPTHKAVEASEGQPVCLGSGSNNNNNSSSNVVVDDDVVVWCLVHRIILYLH